MIKRTVEISKEPAHVTVHLDQLLIQRKRQTVGQIPCEDLGVLLVDQPQVTYSHAALARLMEFDAAVVVCGRDHLPAGILLPLADHSQVVWRVQLQVDVPRPLKKQLWKQLVQAKIRAQAANLPIGAARTRLLAIARDVRSGDPANAEGQAGRFYWPALFDENFRRDPDGAPPNNLLNYGYAVVRAALARCIVAAGLLPALGIKHSNRSNAFCLADDLIEPLRPMVDARVREWFSAGQRDLTPVVKSKLLELLAEPVEMRAERGPLLVNLHRYVASLVRCYEGAAKTLDVPLRATGQKTDCKNPNEEEPSEAKCDTENANFNAAEVEPPSSHASFSRLQCSGDSSPGP
ncbi:MAG: type II CRISPR-associated endonuclease Cas1 [Pirellulales bacterium]|nr:type II CRISPR-associated endonuclease Cas1 [Pirellulales bacterium]